MKKNTRKRTTLMKRMTIRITISMCLVLLVIIGLSYAIMRTTITNLSEQMLVREAKAYENEVEDWIDQVKTPLSEVGRTLKQITFPSDAERKVFLESTVTINKNVPLGVYFGRTDGSYIDGAGWVPDADYVPSERDWFIEGMKNETMAPGEPYIDSQTGEYIVSLSMKISDTEVAAADVFLKDVASRISEISVMDSGSAYLFDTKSGDVLAAKDKKLVGQKVDDCKNEFVQSIIKSANTEGSDDLSNIKRVLDLDNTGSNMKVVTNTIKDTNWVLACCVSEENMLASLDELNIVMAVAGIVLTLIAAVIIFLSLKRNLRAIKNVTQVVGELVEGNFSVEANVQGHDDITTMCEGLNTFIEKMRDIIVGMRNVSSKLDSDSEVTKLSADTMYDAAEVQAEAMGQVSTTVNELARSIESIAEDATTLSEAVSLATENGEQAVGEMNESVSATNTGKVQIQDISEKMQKIKAAINSLEIAVKKVDDSAIEINKITDMIGDIAEQTNLLSLNATIEAARAGEAGRGFTVVATEIGKLSTRSREAASDITKLIENISSEIQDTVERTTEAVVDIEESSETVNSTIVAFDKIFDYIVSSNHLVTEVNEKIKSIDNVAMSMAAITEEQSASTEEILATTEGLAEQANEIKDHSEKIKEVSATLENSAKQMKEQMEMFQ
ncbi:MAG: methyl-accepting chemotaxis protein [Lachnospiraceae bacterium]